MRYSAISPIITGTADSFGSLSAYFRDASARGVRAPGGELRHYSPGTLEKWYLDYKHGGFEALVPASRNDCGVSRKIDDQLREEIRYLKTNYPRLSAAAIYRQLVSGGSIRPNELSESTVCRFINQLMLQEKLSNNQDLRRYERPHINEVWCGDSSVGPYLKTPDGKKHRVYVIALIDDASRFILGADVFFNDNFVNLMSVMKSAVSKYGKPEGLQLRQRCGIPEPSDGASCRTDRFSHQLLPAVYAYPEGQDRALVPHAEGPVDGSAGHEGLSLTG